MTSPVVTAADRICDSADREAWLAARGPLLTASDAPVLLGLSKWKSILQLWMEKRGEPLIVEENEAMWWGTAQEPNLRRWYAEHTGLPCIPDGWLYRSHEFPFIGATPDGWTTLADGLCIPVELKTAAAHGEEDWADGVPDYYMPQVQQQMLVLGSVRSRVVVCFGGNHGAWIEVERDDAMCVRIVDAAREFWRMVNDNERPDPDGSRSSDAALAALYPGDPQAAPVELGQQGVQWSDRLEEIDTALAALNDEREQLRQNIKAEMGSAERGILPGGVGSWTLRRGKGGGLRRSKK